MSVMRSPNTYSSNPDLTAINLEESFNVTMRKRKFSDVDSSVMEALSSFKNQILESLNTFKEENAKKISQLSDDINKGIRDELTKLTNSFHELKASLEHTDQDLQDVKKRVTELEKKSSKIEQLESQVTRLHSIVTDLELERRRDRQRARMLNLEMVGVPECKSESLHEYIMSLAKRAGVQLRLEDIDHVNRVQKMNPNKEYPRNIIFRLSNQTHKDSLLSSLRKSRNITTSDLGIPGDTRKIFVNEHLTPENKMLYKSCREKAKNVGFQYVWIRNCRIYVRKNDQSPHMLIESEVDLRKITK